MLLPIADLVKSHLILKHFHLYCWTWAIYWHSNKQNGITCKHSCYHGL